MLKNIHIQGFKAITGKLELNNLAQVNYLIGPNGSGKSSVLELLHFTSLEHPLTPRQNPYIFGTHFRSNIYGKFSIGLLENNQKYCLLYNWKFLGKIQKTILYGKLLVIKADVCSSSFPYGSLDKIFHDGYENTDQLLMQTPGPVFTSEIRKFFFTADKITDRIELSSLVYLEEFDPLNKILKNNNELKLYNQLLTFTQENPELFSVMKSPKLLSNHTVDDLFWSGMEKFDKDLFHYLKSIQSEEDATSSGKMNLNLFTKIHSILVKKIINYVLIEEPDIALHPQYQKILPKLLSFIAHLHKSTQFFITTHSPFIINAALEQDRERLEEFNGLNEKLKTNNEKFVPIHKVYHLEGGKNTMKDGEGITAQNFSVSGVDNIFSSIGVQPSDLLFANGIVWVEGPSDAIYIEKWLEMYGKTHGKKVFKPGYHFQFQMYGGTLLKFYLERAGKYGTEIRPAIADIFKINTRGFLLMDSDIDSNGNDISSYAPEKKLILEEFKKISSTKVNVWYDTEVSTIECYTPKKEFKEWWSMGGFKFWSDYSKNTNWKTEYAYRLQLIWNKKIKEFDDKPESDCWSEYLKAVSPEAKVGLEKYIALLYSCVDKWNN